MSGWVNGLDLLKSGWLLWSITPKLWKNAPKPPSSLTVEPSALLMPVMRCFGLACAVEKSTGSVGCECASVTRVCTPTPSLWPVLPPARGRGRSTPPSRVPALPHVAALSDPPRMRSPGLPPFPYGAQARRAQAGRRWRRRRAAGGARMRGARAGGGGGGGELKWKMRRSPRAGRRRPTAG